METRRGEERREGRWEKDCCPIQWEEGAFSLAKLAQAAISSPPPAPPPTTTTAAAQIGSGAFVSSLPIFIVEGKMAVGAIRGRGSWAGGLVAVVPKRTSAS